MNEMEETTVIIVSKTTTMGVKKANPSINTTIRPRQSVLILYKNVGRVGHAEFFFELGETEEEKDHYKTTTRLLQDHYKTTARPLQDHYKTTARPLQDQYKTTTRPLQDHYKTTTRPLQL